MAQSYFYKDVLPFSAMLALAAECTNVVFKILFKAAAMKGLSNYVFNAYSYAVSTLVLLPVVFIFSRMENVALRSSSAQAKITGAVVSISAALVLACMNSLFKYLLDLWNMGVALCFITVVHTWGLHLKGPVYISIFRPLSIAIAAAMNVMFLGETLYLGSVVGAILISVGFYGVIWGKAKEEEEKMSETMSLVACTLVSFDGKIQC
ncbi:hypothetical protein CJ030_MR6G023247 [Morella rubra]|uniref:WAT1-related protein n=1 Tax=Morella rubra TaxID=262757 RepID=A0A6A1VIN7_9ROSI|nr:hypothetical protein CJ030_MR6G023247 [Morella rubra]